MRSTLVYLLLVGAPLVGLSWILRWGQDLAPPPALGGPWALDDGALVPCLGLAGPQLTIEQSGQFLMLGLAETRIAARLHEHAFETFATARAGTCEGTRLRIHGEVDPRAETIAGWVDGACPSCASVPFSARRIIAKAP